MAPAVQGAVIISWAAGNHSNSSNSRDACSPLWRPESATLGAAGPCSLCGGIGAPGGIPRHPKLLVAADDLWSLACGHLTGGETSPSEATWLRVFSEQRATGEAHATRLWARQLGGRRPCLGGTHWSPL